MGWAMLATLGASGIARADIWIEGQNGTGDAGQLPATAQITSGNPPLTAIMGTIDTPTDVDMFAIRITNPAAFSATTVGQPGTLFDTQLFLFDATGRGVEANDDVSTTDLRSTLTPFSGAPGLYYLAISSFNSDPVVPGGLRIFPEPEETIAPVFGLPVGPTGPGGGQPVADWTTGGLSSGTYQIALTGAEPAQVPEPTSVTLLALGIVGLALIRVLRGKRAGAEPPGTEHTRLIA
jgi:hypothetical protein